MNFSCFQVSSYIIFFSILKHYRLDLNIISDKDYNNYDIKVAS